MASEEFARALEQLSMEYRAAIPQKLEAIEAHWRCAGEQPPEALRQALHTLAGSAKTFGLGALTEAASAAETFLDPCCDRRAALTAGERTELEGLLNAVKRAAIEGAA